MSGRPYVITFLKRKSESGVWIPYSDDHMMGHVVSQCLSSHMSGHVQSQVIPPHGFILLDCRAVTPQWRNRLQGSRTILPVLFWLDDRVVPLPLCYSDWSTGSYHSYMLFPLDTIIRCLSNVPFCSIPQHLTGGPKPALNLTYGPPPYVYKLAQYNRQSLRLSTLWHPPACPSLHS